MKTKRVMIHHSQARVGKELMPKKIICPKPNIYSLVDALRKNKNDSKAQLELWLIASGLVRFRLLKKFPVLRKAENNGTLDEIIYEIWCKIRSSAQKFKGTSKGEAIKWVNIISSNTALRYIKKIHHDLPLDDHQPDTGYEPTQHDSVETKNALKKVEEIVNENRKGSIVLQRRALVFELRIKKHLSYKQIASDQGFIRLGGTNVGMAKQDFRRIRQQIISECKK